MILVATGLYIACCLAFYLQVLIHHKLHASLAVESEVLEAEIIDLFPPAELKAA